MSTINGTPSTKFHGGTKPLPLAIGLVVFLALSFIVASFGARFETGWWYQQLIKPSWTPPGWIFGPVWTLLYILMAVSAWLVWRQGGVSKNFIPLVFYAIQLAFNALWSWFFFGMNQVGLALVDIVLLVAAILITTLMFFKRNRLAGIFMLPYLLWVSFATLLNLQIWRLN